MHSWFNLCWLFFCVCVLGLNKMHQNCRGKNWSCSRWLLSLHIWPVKYQYWLDCDSNIIHHLNLLISPSLLRKGNDFVTDHQLLFLSSIHRILSVCSPAGSAWRSKRYRNVIYVRHQLIPHFFSQYKSYYIYLGKSINLVSKWTNGFNIKRKRKEKNS